MDVQTLIIAMKKKGYAVFESDTKNYNLNIVGVRNITDDINRFDDNLYTFWKYNGTWNFEAYQATTDPGKYWLNNPMSSKGTAILVPGQYRSTWEVALHQDKYEALCQRKPVKVFRDNDQDNELDFISESIESGIFGINIHRSNPYTESSQVDKWSAGCQVFKRAKDFYDFMNLCNKSAKIWGDKFTYTLLTDKDF